LNFRPSPQGRTAWRFTEITTTSTAALFDRSVSHAFDPATIGFTCHFALVELLFCELHSRASIVTTNAIEPSTTAMSEPRKSQRMAKYTDALAEHIITAFAM
jgi:hypothetical protein